MESRVEECHRGTESADSGPCGQVIPVDVGTENALMWAPIPPEPAPCHRPWITPLGATPKERKNHIKLDFGDSILALQSRTMAR